MSSSPVRSSPPSTKQRCRLSGTSSSTVRRSPPSTKQRRSPPSTEQRCAGAQEQVSNRTGTFSVSGRKTSHVPQRPTLFNNPQTPPINSIPDPVVTNAPRCARAQADIRTFGMISTRKARAIARSQSAATDSEAVLNSSSPNQADVSAHPVSKKKRKRGRGCNKGEEAPANRADRRHISLTPLGGWSDKKVRRTIGSHLRTGLKGGHPNWTEMPNDNKRTLWNKFESTYVWDPVEDGTIRALWEKSMGASLTEAVYDARELYEATKEKPEWCADQHWLELLAYWKSPKFLRRSKAAKANRRKGPRASHTTGSKTMERAGIEKALEQGIPAIPFIENYADTHMKRNPDDPNATPQWIDPKFKDAYDRYVEDCTNEFGEDRTNWPVVVDAEKWTKAVGSPKKGRVMGLSVHVDLEELGFNTRKRSLFPRVSLSSQDSQKEVVELKDQLEEVKKIAEDATAKCAQLQALVESQRNQHAELMDFVRNQMQTNRSQDAIGSSSIGGGGGIPRTRISTLMIYSGHRRMWY